MNFNNLFSKSKDLLNKGVNSVKNAVNEKKETMHEFDLLITKSDHLPNLKPYEALNPIPSKGREQLILAVCLTMNVEKAKLVNSLLPVSESIIDIEIATESKTQMEYWFIITNNKLWIANRKEYKTVEFNKLSICQIVSKGLMTQSVNFNQNAFVFEGGETEIRKFCATLMNAETRDAEIAIKTGYLCGVTPKEQYLNIYMTGITIGTNNEIVLHNGKVKNQKVALEDIEYMQLMMDNSVVMTKGKKDMQSMISAQNDCHKMTLKVVLKTENFLIEVMPPNVMNTLVKKEDSLYQTSYAFAKNIIDILEKMLN